MVSSKVVKRNKMKKYNFLSILLFSIFSILKPTISYSNQYDEIIYSCKEKVINNNSLCTTSGISDTEIKGITLIPEPIVQEVLGHCGNQNPELSIILARQKINELYACIGYINSGAVLKETTKGTFSLEVVEGTVSNNDIEVTDVDVKTEEYIKHSLMGKNAVKPLNINDIRGRLELLKKSNIFKSINATVAPLENKIGQAKIIVSVKESDPYNWAISLNNQQSESTGEHQLLLSGSRQGVLSLFDSIGSNISISEGSHGLEIFYTNATSQKSSWNVSLERRESKIISEPLKSLDITSDSTKFHLGYNHQLNNSLITHDKSNDSNKITWHSKLELLNTNNYLLDRAFSFSAGENEGEASITSIHSSIYFEKKHRSDLSNSAMSASTGFDIGVEALGSTKKTTDSAGSKYKILKAALGYKRLVTEHSNISINMNGQYSDDFLLASKRLGLGGVGSVRGSEKNIISLDSGITLSADTTTLLPRLSGTPFVVSSAVDGNLYGNIFADYTYGRENRSKESYGLGSVGLGITWYPTKYSKLNISWAKPVSFKGFIDDEINSIDEGKLEFNLTISGGN